MLFRRGTHLHPVSHRIMGSVVEVVLRRPDLNTRLGIRFFSETPDDPPVVKGVAGVAATSNLKEGDVILRIDGEDARNSVFATGLIENAGTVVRLDVRRPDGGSVLDVTIARNALGLGLLVDASNTITDLVEGSAAAVHGELHIGQRIIAVDGQKIAPNAPLAPLIPQGTKPFVLSVVRTNKSAPLPGGSSSRSLAATGSPPSPPPSPAAQLAPKREAFSRSQLRELNNAFIVLGGSEDAVIGPSQVLAAVSHFEKESTIEGVSQMCLRHSQTGDGQVDVNGFVNLMQELASTVGPPQAVFDALDQPGLGMVSAKEAEGIIRSLSKASNVPPSDVAAMVAMLKPGKDGLLHKDISRKALNEAFAQRI